MIYRAHIINEYTNASHYTEFEALTQEEANNKAVTYCKKKGYQYSVYSITRQHDIQTTYML